MTWSVAYSDLARGQLPLERSNSLSLSLSLGVLMAMVICLNATDDLEQTSMLVRVRRRITALSMKDSPPLQRLAESEGEDASGLERESVAQVPPAVGVPLRAVLATVLAAANRRIAGWSGRGRSSAVAVPRIADVPLARVLPGARRLPSVKYLVDDFATLGFGSCPGEFTIHQDAMSRKAKPSLGEVQPLMTDAERERLRPAKEMLERDALKGITFREAAAAVGLSPNHFHRRFTLAFGVTPKHITTTAQVAEAQRLMLAGARLDDIPAACGWADQSHFVARFRQEVGETPARWLRARASRASGASTVVPRSSKRERDGLQLPHDLLGGGARAHEPAADASRPLPEGYRPRRVEALADAVENFVRDARRGEPLDALHAQFAGAFGAAEVNAVLDAMAAAGRIAFGAVGPRVHVVALAATESETR